MWWKAHFKKEKKDAKENETQTLPETYGLKSLNCPTQVQQLIQFERDLLDIKKSLKLWKKEAISKRDWKTTYDTVHDTDTILAFSDETFNLYKLKKEQYQKMLIDSITTTYKNANNNIHKKINTDGKKLMKDKDI